MEPKPITSLYIEEIAQLERQQERISSLVQVQEARTERLEEQERSVYQKLERAKFRALQAALQENNLFRCSWPFKHDRQPALPEKLSLIPLSQLMVVYHSFYRYGDSMGTTAGRETYLEQVCQDHNVDDLNTTKPNEEFPGELNTVSRVVKRAGGYFTQVGNIEVSDEFLHLYYTPDIYQHFDLNPTRQAFFRVSLKDPFRPLYRWKIAGKNVDETF